MNSPPWDIVAAYDQRMPAGHSPRLWSRRGTWRCTAIAVGTLTALGLLSVPVTAEIARLRSIPLGKGSATVSWTGASGTKPTIGPISGSARGLPIVATGVVPPLPQQSGTGLGTTSLSIPASLPVADITGTIEGTAFTLDISLNLSNLSLTSKAAQTFGTVTGSFHGQPIHAILTGRTTSNVAHFSGTIGSDHVTGTIGRTVHHGDRTTGTATFDVTR